MTFCTFEERGGVFFLTLNSGDTHHYLTKAAIDELGEALAKIREQAMANQSRGLITTSSMGSFCDGIDYARIRATSLQSVDAQVKLLADGMAAVTKELLEMPMLTVCAATGNASSLGFALALAHDDLVVLSEATYALGMVEEGVAVPQYVGGLLRDKTERWYTLTTLKSRRRSGKWMKDWYFADSHAGNRMEVLHEAEKLVSGWAGDGPAHAATRKCLLQETWDAVSKLS